MAPSRKRIAGVQNGPWLLVMPALMLLVVFYLYPLVQILRVSFVEPVPGLGNYALLATSAPIQRILLTTLRIGALTTLISLLLAYAIAYALAHASDRRRRLMFLCVLVPFWISVLVRAFAWVALLRSQGLLNNTLVAIGLITQPLELLYNEIGVVIGMVHYMVPLAVLTLYGQMSGIDRRLVPAARGLGAGATAAFLRIYLPMSSARHSCRRHPGVRLLAWVLHHPCFAGRRQDADGSRIHQSHGQGDAELGARHGASLHLDADRVRPDSRTVARG